MRTSSTTTADMSKRAFITWLDRALDEEHRLAQAENRGMITMKTFLKRKISDVNGVYYDMVPTLALPIGEDNVAKTRRKNMLKKMFGDSILTCKDPDGPMQ